MLFRLLPRFTLLFPGLAFVGKLGNKAVWLGALWVLLSAVQPVQGQGTRRLPVREGSKEQNSNQAPVKEKEATPLSPKKLEEALRLLLNSSNKDSVQVQQQKPLEIESFVIDQTVTKIGHDFYDIFYNGWEPPPGLSDFTIVIREKPGRGITTIISMEVNDNQLLELPLQPKYEAIEEAAFYSLDVAQDFLVNSSNVSQQLERSDDDPGTEVF